MVLAYLCELDTIHLLNWLKLMTFICDVQIDAGITKLWPQFPDSLSPGDKRVWPVRLKKVRNPKILVNINVSSHHSIKSHAKYIHLPCFEAPQSTPLVPMRLTWLSSC